jgi:hypothetical protein
MTFDPYGYQDPMQPFPGNPGAPGGPLDGLQEGVASVLNSADSHHVYVPGPGGGLLTYPRGHQPSVLGAMIKGAALGFGSWLIWHRMQRRHSVKGEYTSPGFRALGLLLGFPALGFLLSMAWISETGLLFGGGIVLGVVSFVAYAIFRVTGHGRYNSNRAGSPWRQDHQRGGRC